MQSVASSVLFSVVIFA